MIENEKPSPAANVDKPEPAKNERQASAFFFVLGILCWGYVAVHILLYGLIAINLINAIPFVIGLYFVMNYRPNK